MLKSKEKIDPEHLSINQIIAFDKLPDDRLKSEYEFSDSTISDIHRMTKSIMG
jgi:hypothetical protein